MVVGAVFVDLRAESSRSHDPGLNRLAHGEGFDRLLPLPGRAPRLRAESGTGTV